jgi:hypothetical protein
VTGAARGRWRGRPAPRFVRGREVRVEAGTAPTRWPPSRRRPTTAGQRHSVIIGTTCNRQGRTGRQRGSFGSYGAPFGTRSRLKTGRRDHNGTRSQVPADLLVVLRRRRRLWLLGWSRPRPGGRRAALGAVGHPDRGSGALPESPGSVRYDRIAAFDLGGTRDLGGALKLVRGPLHPWYCETLPVKCRSWPRRAAPSWRPSYGDSQSLIIREPRAARSRS